MIRLWFLRLKRRGLMRERRRLHMERAGCDWALQVNERDAVQCETEIAVLIEKRKRREFDRRYGVTVVADQGPRRRTAGWQTKG